MRMFLFDIDSYHGIIIHVRTTLSLDDDIFHVVKAYAENRSLALGKAILSLSAAASARPLFLLATQSRCSRAAYSIPHTASGRKILELPKRLLISDRA
jgi:hypothetical protein